MTAPITNAKAILREQIRARLKAISAAHRTVESAQLCARLHGAEVWQAAHTVLLFAPLPDEPDIWPLLADALHADKRVALPSFDKASEEYCARQIQDRDKDILSGQFSVREPGVHCPVLALNQLDLMLVPGVAFDLGGWRLGRGRGFYDRLLPLAGGVKCGVAFDEQIVDAIPTEPHDVKLNRILTPTRWL